MSDEKAFLAAIWAHPHEDTPRLMYADWLQENGQSDRAEFIRIQIEAANLPPFDPERVSKANRARQLLAPHVEGWVEPFRWIFADLQPVAWGDQYPSPLRIWESAVGVTGLQHDKALPVDDYAPELRFDRGFVSEITTTLATLLGHSPSSRPRWGPPPKVSVRWPYGGEIVDPSRVFPELRERLTFDNYSGWQFANPGSIGDSGLVALADEPDLAAGLASLDAVNSDTPENLHRVLPLAKRLTHLSSCLTDADSRKVLPLIRAAIASGVNDTVTDFHAVNLFADFLDVSAVVTELAVATWPNLKRLLFYQWTGELSLVAGIAGDPFPRLEQLTLLGEAISRDQLTAVLECPAFRSARVKYYEHGEQSRPEILELEALYAPRFQCRT